MSARPMLAGTSTSGRPRPPPPALSWRTRRETMFTSTFGLPTFSLARLQSSAFICSKIELASIPDKSWRAITKFLSNLSDLTHIKCYRSWAVDEERALALIPFAIAAFVRQTMRLNEQTVLHHHGD